MAQEVQIALIVAVPSLIGPLTMAVVTSLLRRKERLEDWARQDEVAARVQEVKERAETTDTKLDTIHKLVNSEMTARMQAQLDALRGQLTLMKELAELRGGDSSAETQAVIHAAQARVDELAKAIEEREKAAEREQSD